MSYWDTSALIKLYAREQDSVVFERHFQFQGGAVAFSRVAVWEARATFRRKEADGILATGMTQKLHEQLLADLAAAKWRVIEAGEEVAAEFNRVLDLCHERTPPLFLRTLDAIHLASARVAGETEIVATDKRLREAAVLLGFTLFPA